MKVKDEDVKKDEGRLLFGPGHPDFSKGADSFFDRNKEAIIGGLKIANEMAKKDSR